MPSAEDSVALIRRAKNDDREAWDALCTRYYPRWLRQFHGRLGNRLRQLHDTDDLIQSAVTEALRKVEELREDAAFFSWVSAIIRRKIVDYSRREARRPGVPLEEIPDPQRQGGQFLLRIETEEEYVRFLDSVLELFEVYAEHMAIFYLRYFENLDIAGLKAAFGQSERTIHRRLENALELVRSKVSAP